MAPRPVGILLGLEASVNPFSRCVSYGEIAGLPLAERVAALRQPERRQRILAEHADVMAKARESGVMTVINRFESMYLLADPVDYDLSATSSLTEFRPKEPTQQSGSTARCWDTTEPSCSMPRS